MKKLGNFLWCLLGGFIFAAVYFLLGLVLCLTIVGIPFGKQYLKLAKLVFKPFGKSIVYERRRPTLNFIFNILGGVIFGLFYGVLGVVLCITIVGIPFGMQCFKLAKLGAFPFGAEIK